MEKFEFLDLHLQQIHEHADSSLLCMELFQELLDVALIPNHLELRLPRRLTALQRALFNLEHELLEP
jgi:hypothetical protein